MKRTATALAVLVAGLALTACGSQEAPQTQPVAQETSQAVVVEEVETTDTLASQMTQPLPTESTRTDCWQVTTEILDEINALLPGPELVAYLQSLPDPSEGCTERDQHALETFDDQLAQLLD